MSQFVLDSLRSTFGDAILETHSYVGDDTAIVASESWKTICEYLRSDPSLDFNMFVDLCAVDYPDRLPRMEVVLHLYSVTKNHRIRLKTKVGGEEMEGAEVDSITSVWAGANWFEREVYDLSGVIFRGHPDLRRILMYPEFEGHPLRKDYPADRTQPLIPYRTEEEAGLPLGKLPPFAFDEGMPFGRRAWADTELMHGAAYGDPVTPVRPPAKRIPGAKPPPPQQR